jgi:hypothetical protein
MADNSASWCAGKLKHESILRAQAVGDNLMEIEVAELGTAFVATMSQHVVSMGNVPPTATRQETQFLLNIPKDALFQGDVIAFAGRAPIGIGGIADLYRAVNDKDLRGYVHPERKFLTRLLTQHSAVSGVELLNNQTYLIHRDSLGLGAYQVLVVNEYDVTADVIRSNIEKFGHSRTIYASNPSGRVTPEAKEAAKHAGVRVVDLSQLLGALNS